VCSNPNPKYVECDFLRIEVRVETRYNSQPCVDFVGTGVLILILPSHLTYKEIDILIHTNEKRRKFSEGLAIESISANFNPPGVVEGFVGMIINSI